MTPYPIVNAWRKRHYLARVTGPHSTYVVDRDFVQGRPIKSRGIVAYEAGDIGDLPAWLIRADDRGVRELIAANEIGWVSHGGMDSAGILSVFEHGLPGEPDAWQGERCLDCHESPTFPDGAARCQACTDSVIARAGALALTGSAPDPW